VRLVSTRGGHVRPQAKGARPQAAQAPDAVGFRQAIFTGLAPDGGLYVPAPVPDLRELLGGLGADDTFLRVAQEVSSALFGEELPKPGAVERVVRSAFPFAPRLRPLEPGLQLLELFHGPTCAFKDFGASFLAAVMEEFLLEEQRRALILVATSGDTGSAVARAFHRRRNIEVVILYPSGRVSSLQEQQLTTVGDNVVALEVAGSFDDCQRLAKEAFLDRELSAALPLTSANSINPGRLLPQAFYYIYGRCRFPAREPVAICVPSGNFGNLTAGVYAWQWGLPVARFLAATNLNDVVPEYLRTGSFRPRASLRTLSNAMDVGNPSNFERLSAVFGGDLQAMRGVIEGVRVDDEQTRATIRSVYSQAGVLLDPHTAVGVLACREYRERTGFGGTILTLATAHPGKFVEIVEEATGLRPELPQELREALRRPKRSVPVGTELQELKSYLLERYA
jgi:threonine synthase